MLYASLTESKPMTLSLSEAPADDQILVGGPAGALADRSGAAGADENGAGRPNQRPELPNATQGGLPGSQHGLSDARQIHEELKALHACGNEVHLAKIARLREVYARGLCYELGYSSYQQYCDLEFGIARSTAYECLRVADALDNLTQLRRLFTEGEYRGLKCVRSLAWQLWRPSRNGSSWRGRSRSLHCEPR